MDGGATVRSGGSLQNKNAQKNKCNVTGCCHSSTFSDEWINNKTCKLTKHYLEMKFFFTLFFVLYKTVS